MEPVDTRKPTPEVQNYLRQRAIDLRQQGEALDHIATFLGVHRDTVSGWWLSRSIPSDPVTADSTPPMQIPIGHLRGVHHIALNVQDMSRSRQFYGEVLGLHELTGSEVPATLKDLVAVGKVANFRLPDGTILDLFGEPDLLPPHDNPRQQFTRANHLAFDIAPELFDRAVAVLLATQVPIDHGPVSRPTGRGIYFYDPDGFLLEIRCDANR
jgi:glyoxylase I family protein